MLGKSSSNNSIKSSTTLANISDCASRQQQLKVTSLVSIDNASLVQEDNVDDGGSRISKDVKHHSTDKIVTDYTYHDCSLTKMLLLYAQLDEKEEIMRNTTGTPPILTKNNILDNVLTLLEMHFQTHADEEHHIYFEGLFQILYSFRDNVTEIQIIETMRLLKLNVNSPISFETFIMIVCHLPKYRSAKTHSYLDVFIQLDANHDSYVTYDDVLTSLPKLALDLNEESIKTAIHMCDIDHDNDKLSYFDFVTSMLALRYCKLILTNNNEE
ncbi:unnamed protein product [Didymodactylos carnosus]|uniref:EF-hand domain-containing protein n=1 Tax=Didymodactylos carnosus TaxID=1234261 RepID=A0A8S2F3L0_9BILA|nr:unnamed protein product [Didymodactylos carnosus]CAF4125488.1 unnamed protein product [Didymodactylos carnosus]